MVVNKQIFVVWEDGFGESWFWCLKWSDSSCSGGCVNRTEFASIPPYFEYSKIR